MAAERAGPCVFIQCADLHDNAVLFAKVSDFCAHMTEEHGAEELEVGISLLLPACSCVLCWVLTLHRYAFAEEEGTFSG